MITWHRHMHTHANNLAYYVQYINLKCGNGIIFCLAKTRIIKHSVSAILNIKNCFLDLNDFHVGSIWIIIHSVTDPLFPS